MTRTTPIRWNCLHLALPDSWEVIVKNSRHLILEKDLKPVAELRWQTPSPRHRQVDGDRIARQLEPGGHFVSRPDLVDSLPARVGRKFTIETFSLDDDSPQAVHLLICKKCSTPVLIRIYSTLSDILDDYALVLDSLDCHPEQDERGKWQIQDFHFTLPDGFELERSSFRFGLSALYFTSATAALHLCRLAPASHHLQTSSLADLFQSFSSARPEQQTADNPQSLRYRHVPNLGERFWGRIRRKKLYQASHFVHFPHHDRILGYSILSRKPIENRIETLLEDGYGIVQEKETATSPDA